MLFGNTGEVPGYGAFCCMQNYLHNCFCERKTTFILFCHVKYVLGVGLREIVIMSLTLFLLGEWQDLYPWLRIELSSNLSFWESPLLKKWTHTIMTIVHIASYPVHTSIHFSPQGEVINLSMQITHRLDNHAFIFPYLSFFLALCKMRSRCLKKTVTDYILFSFTSTQVPWLCSFQICMQLSNKSPSKSTKTRVLIRLNYCWPNPI